VKRLREQMELDVRAALRTLDALEVVLSANPCAAEFSGVKLAMESLEIELACQRLDALTARLGLASP
jgi:hypothetical protein